MKLLPIAFFFGILSAILSLGTASFLEIFSIFWGGNLLIETTIFVVVEEFWKLFFILAFYGLTNQPRILSFLVHLFLSAFFAGGFSFFEIILIILSDKTFAPSFVLVFIIHFLTSFLLFYFCSFWKNYQKKYPLFLPLLLPLLAIIIHLFHNLFALEIF